MEFSCLYANLMKGKEGDGFCRALERSFYSCRTACMEDVPGILKEYGNNLAVFPVQIL